MVKIEGCTLKWSLNFFKHKKLSSHNPFLLQLKYPLTLKTNKFHSIQYVNNLICANLAGNANLITPGLCGAKKYCITILWIINSINLYPTAPPLPRVVGSVFLSLSCAVSLENVTSWSSIVIRVLFEFVKIEVLFIASTRLFFIAKQRSTTPTHIQELDETILYQQMAYYIHKQSCLQNIQPYYMYLHSKRQND